MTVGIPLPRGAANSPEQISLQIGGCKAGLQATALEHWHDRSIRWLLLDFLASSQTGPEGHVVHFQPVQIADGPSVVVTRRGSGVEVLTGSISLAIEPGGPFPLSQSAGGSSAGLDFTRSGLRIGFGDSTHEVRVADVDVEHDGPLRAQVRVRAEDVHTTAGRRLEIEARLEFFAGSSVVRMAITLRNPSRASHPGGKWPLGDPGSLFLRHATLAFSLSSLPHGAQCAPEPGLPMTPVEMPFSLLQESSGGQLWQSPVHRNRDGLIPLRFRGYRLRSGSSERTGLRATPTLSVDTPAGPVIVTLPHFWQNFPHALKVDDHEIEVGLFPEDAGDLHELQGGEQKTHRVVMSLGPDTVADTPLAWVHEPQMFCPAPAWSCATGTIPWLVPERDDPRSDYLTLVHQAIKGPHSFFNKRETIDEYGWRNFGELYADHETAFHKGAVPLVSHYNNQYDAIAAFATHFLRSADPRWLELMADLARHVVDIDIYHTREDKAAYNNGLFWHTNHYIDAGTATHRTYPVEAPGGGGPSAEHNYNAGLMLHYFMTGDRASRDAAIGLGQWVIDMDDGSLTPFRWLSRAPTGLASASGSMAYHGPGRGAGNSILACLTAYRLTGEHRFIDKAEELIRRCIHPGDDVDARKLLDVERRWFYTVFLQALGVYLTFKEERGERDAMYAYARTSLVRYAAWMQVNERPYLEHPEILEFPNETWIAQDLRKADVLALASTLSSGANSVAMQGRALTLFDYVVNSISNSGKGHLTRPSILLLSNGLLRYRVTDPHPPVRESSPEYAAAAASFRPQRLLAWKNAARIGIGLIAASLIALIAAMRLA